jgi:hypothetical protein
MRVADNFRVIASAVACFGAWMKNLTEVQRGVRAYRIALQVMDVHRVAGAR